MGLVGSQLEICLSTGFTTWIWMRRSYGCSWGISIAIDMLKIEVDQGDFNDSLVFNNIISHLGLVELPIKGRSFTWSNMQANPLLEQIDWFFTSATWTS
jgi:hypothetical protein